MSFVTVLTLLSLVSVASGYDSGAPVQLPRVCEDMNPQQGHGGEPKKTTDSPFTLQSDSSCWKEDIDLMFRIVVSPNPDYHYYEGFFVQARRTDGSNQAYGNFKAIGANNKATDCFNKTGNAITHVNIPAINLGGGHIHFFSQNFTWKADSTDPKEDFHFYYTVARNKDNYWVKMHLLVKYDANCQTPSGTFPTPTPTPSGTFPTTTTPTPSGTFPTPTMPTPSSARTVLPVFSLFICSLWIGLLRLH